MKLLRAAHQRYILLALLPFAFFANTSISSASPYSQDSRDPNGESRWAGISHFIRLVGSVCLTVAPFLITLSFAYSAFLFVISAGRKNVVEKARNQFKRTLIAVAIIGGFFMFKAFATRFMI